MSPDRFPPPPGSAGAGDRVPLPLLLRDHLRMAPVSHPAAVISASRVTITLHAVDDGDVWTWKPSGPTGYLALVFPIDDAEVVLGAGPVAADDPRSPVLLENGRVSELTWTRGSAATVWLPESAIDDLGLDVTRVSDRVAPTTSALAARAFITTVARIRPVFSPLEALVMERALIDITFAMFFAAGERAVVAAARVSTFARVRLHFESRFTDPTFSVGSAAKELHVSARHLERLFERRGTSPSAYLRMLRVDFARALLDVREDSGTTVQTIARRSGFASARTMRRAMSETVSLSA